MAKDFAFMFYPGEYLRDTQCLSEKAQVAYDRIMCEHMRNISDDVSNIAISKDKVNFFIKRLSEEEKNEIFHVLTKVVGGFHIEWVAISVSKRKSYSDSRAKNRGKKNNNISEDMNNTEEVMVNKDNSINNTYKVKQEKNGTKFSGNFKAQGEELLLNRIGRHLSERQDAPIDGIGKEDSQ